MSTPASNAGSPPPGGFGGPRKRIRGAVDTSLILDGERSRKRTSNAVEVRLFSPSGCDEGAGGLINGFERGNRGGAGGRVGKQIKVDHIDALQSAYTDTATVVSSDKLHAKGARL